MNWTNYHHLLYFYTTIQEGGISKAAKKLHVSQPTVSKLLNTFEFEIGQKIWDKNGRDIHLTEVGETLYKYADEIFRLGNEMQNVIKTENSIYENKLNIGLNQALPKIYVSKILRPHFDKFDDLRLNFIEAPLEKLTRDLKEYKIDMILSDAPALSDTNSSNYNHLLIESQIGIYSTLKAESKYLKDFPKYLGQIPLILPSHPSPLRRSFDELCLKLKISPNIVVECDDNGLMKTLGTSGFGAFLFPLVLEDQIKKNVKVKCLGVLPELKEKIWLISANRKRLHPVIQNILASYTTSA